MRTEVTVALLLQLARPTNAWVISSPNKASPAIVSRRSPTPATALFLADEADIGFEFESEAQKKEAVGNLVADDEWTGITMELTEVVRTAILEDIKSNARDFLGKDEYKLGDISKEVDDRVKEEISNFRGKDNCK